MMKLPLKVVLMVQFKGFFIFMKMDKKSETKRSYHLYRSIVEGIYPNYEDKIFTIIEDFSHSIQNDNRYCNNGNEPTRQYNGTNSSILYYRSFLFIK